MCREALCTAENIIHPRLPVLGIEALSRCITDSRSQVDADIADTELSLFDRQFDRGNTDDQSDVEVSEDNVADVEVHGSSQSSVIETCQVPAAPCTVPPMEFSHTEEPVELPADDVVCSLNEEAVTEAAETAAVRNVDNETDTTFPVAGQELETSNSDSVPFVSTASSSFVISPHSLSRTALNTVTETSAAEESFERLRTTPVVGPTVSECSGSDEVQECSQLESQQSLRKRKHSTASSVNDGEDSESEGGEIEV